jgi:hypothetical protein
MFVSFLVRFLVVKQNAQFKTRVNRVGQSDGKLSRFIKEISRCCDTETVLCGLGEGKSFRLGWKMNYSTRNNEVCVRVEGEMVVIGAM